MVYYFLIFIISTLQVTNTVWNMAMRYVLMIFPIKDLKIIRNPFLVAFLRRTP